MGKWFAAGTIALIALLVLLWYEIHSPVEIAAAAPVHAAPAPAPVEAPAPSGLQKAVAQVAKAEVKSDKMETDSDEFFNTFQDVVTQVITRNAMSCYQGGLHTVHRNAKVKFELKEAIKDGKMVVTEARVAESTIDDPEMIACFQRQILKTTMENARWPDYQQPDMVLIRPGRNVNKFGKEAMEYEGSGPDFTKEHPVKSAP